MENEENRGLIDKNASEDQLVPFLNVTFLSVQFWSSLIFLSLSLTLGHLEFSWSISALDQERERKEKEGQGKERKGK